MKRLLIAILFLLLAAPVWGDNLSYQGITHLTKASSFLYDITTPDNIVSLGTETIASSTDYIRFQGSRTLKVDLTGNSGNMLKSNINFSVDSSRLISCDIYNPNLFADSATGTISFRFFNVSGDTSAYTEFKFASTSLKQGWNTLKMTDLAFTRDGATINNLTPEKELTGVTIECGTGGICDFTSAITRIQIIYSGYSGLTFYMDEVRNGAKIDPFLIIGWDASGQDLIDYALPVMQSHNAPAYLTSAFVYDGQSAPAQARIDILFLALWEVINHSYTHPQQNPTPAFYEAEYPGEYLVDTKLIDFTTTLVEREVADNKVYIDGKGWTNAQQVFAYPENSVPDLADITPPFVAAGITYGRARRRDTVPVTEFGITNPYHMGSVEMGAGVTTSDMKQNLDNAVMYGDGLILYGHNVDSGGDGENPSGVAGHWYDSQLEAFLTYAESLGVRFTSFNDLDNWGSVYNETIYNNTVGSTARPNITAGQDDMVSVNTINVNLLYASDNTNGGWCIVSDSFALLDGSSNNCYYSDRALPFEIGGVAKSFADYVADGVSALGAGFEADSIFIDPQFISATDFHLQLGSPCINSGLNSVVTTGTDTDLDSRLWVSPVEMGAYQFMGIGPIPESNYYIPKNWYLPSNLYTPDNLYTGSK